MCHFYRKCILYWSHARSLSSAPHVGLHTDERLLFLLQSHARAERRDERARIDLGDVRIRLAVSVKHPTVNKQDENAKAVKQMIDTGHVDVAAIDLHDRTETAGV